MNQPSLTIAIPVLNGENYICQAVESALSQSQPANEILVVNNHSSDGTLDCINRYKSQIRLVSHDQTLSMAKNWTSCFELASSEFVMMLHADDELFPEAIKLTGEVLQVYPDVDHIFGQTWLYDGRRSFPERSEKFGLLSAENYFLRSCASFYHYNSGSTTRRELALGIGGYDETFRHVTDVDFFIRIGMNAREVYAIDKPLGTYRLHKNNLHKNLNKEAISDQEYLLLFKRITEELNLPPMLRQKAMRQLFPVLCRNITSLLRRGELKQALDGAKEISKMCEQQDWSLQTTLSKNSKIVFDLCRQSYVGTFVAWLLIRVWEFRYTYQTRSSRSQRDEYTLEELIELTNQCE
jgi:glycosyltransferase involved in cell wall biosynthesis